MKGDPSGNALTREHDVIKKCVCQTSALRSEAWTCRMVYICHVLRAVDADDVRTRYDRAAAGGAMDPSAHLDEGKRDHYTIPPITHIVDAPAEVIVTVPL